MKKIIISIGILAFGHNYAQKTKDSTHTQEIKEVSLSKKVFQKKSDSFVYDVASSPVAKGNTAFNLLKETPLLSSTDDKTFKITGKSSAIIYINGRKTQMDAEAVTAFLKNTPAENIQKIEVITLPGSEYQVESNDGIINIILKKKADNGWNGNVKLSDNQGFYNNPSTGVSTNFRKDKLAINANFNFNKYTSYQYYQLENGNSQSSNHSEGFVKDPNLNYGGYLNIDYALTDNSNLALSYNTRYNQSRNSISDLLNTVKHLDEAHNWISNYNRTKSREYSQAFNNSINLNYELKTDSLGSKLNINLAYLNYNRNQNSTNTTLNVDDKGKENTPNNRPSLLSQIVQSTPQDINNFSGMVDYVQKFKNDFSLSIGGNLNYTRTDNNTQLYTDTWNPIQQDYQRTYQPNHFIYTEKIYGFYLTLDKKITDQLSAKIGGRYEITRSIGESSNSTHPEMKYIERKYQNFLPYASINYAINKDHNLSYAFSSRMRRPSFWELNPVITYLTQFNYIQNNPFVKAASTYNQELTYMYKNSYFLIIGQSFHKDMIQQIPLQRNKEIELVTTDSQGNPIIDPSTGNPTTYTSTISELRYIRTNFGKKQELTLSLGMQKSFFKNYWNTNVTLGVQHNRMNGYLDTDPLTGEKFTPYSNQNNSTSFITQINNNIQLDQKKTWYAGVNFWYITRQQIELGELGGLGSLDLSLKKIVHNWTLMVSASDLLNTNKIVIHEPKGNTNYNYVNQKQYNRQVTLSVTYNFGNQKVKGIRKLETATESIKNRTN
ncbi:TonB-dependent receptor domain-containing protein [Elizabethkingia sp. JS20170427COW]|uniref:TonB-dependent receptor domain-containing protein n=1 Tax=Elizabethkingia sp. JS20170427COW TaxID=2583851 RepID=UPI001110A28F|nr:TonB-dependent receptor [Elizabethkingia sp. JS20170427COW]QCX52868.1 TonB-dependent receptor [Elizabethkingia sp. JS20170427COW]